MAILLSGCRLARPALTGAENFNYNVAVLTKYHNRDVRGHDFKTIPRYPKSVRIVYQRRVAGRRITYFLAYRAAADLGAVSAFYEREMKTKGWRLEIKKDEFLTMFFVRARGGLPLAQIMFQAVSSVRRPNGTIVSIIIQE